MDCRCKTPDPQPTYWVQDVPYTVCRGCAKISHDERDVVMVPDADREPVAPPPEDDA